MRTARVDIRTQDLNLNGIHDYSGRILKIQNPNYRTGTENVSCQSNINTLTCNCKNVEPSGGKYFSFPKQVYRYSDCRSHTDIGVGSVKKLHRKRIKRIYLPETTDTAVGSENLSSYIYRRSRKRWADCSNNNKQTISKCVGEFMANHNRPLISKKLSPIIQWTSGTTSPEFNKSIGCYCVPNYTKTTQVNAQDFNAEELNRSETVNRKVDTNKISPDATVKHFGVVLPTNKIKNNFETCEDFSTDSFVRQVRYLENPYDEKQSKIFIDPIAYKLERELRKKFTTETKDRPSIGKPNLDTKGSSLLRRRFESLRKVLSKKEYRKDNAVINQNPSRKDMSIATDPVLLKIKSYSNEKVYKPSPSTTREYEVLLNSSYKNIPKVAKVKNKHANDQDMFKSRSKKFDLNGRDTTKAMNVPKITENEPNSTAKYPLTETDSKKKQGRKFFFFRKKNKVKEKSKKGATAGKCEVKDGLAIQVDVGIDRCTPQMVKNSNVHKSGFEGTLHKEWLEKFIADTDSKNSVHIRWNNKMYAASSSTVLELMDSVYNRRGLNLKSQRDVTETPNYLSYTKHRVQFVHQDIETWMVPTMFTDKQKEILQKACNSENRTKNLPTEISDYRWFLDANKGFSKKIELVLHSKPNDSSSKYVIINIPKGYFSQSISSGIQTQSSDEKIYKIVEYDSCDVNEVKESRIANGDDVTNNLNVIVQDDERNNEDNRKNTTDIRLLQRDVAIQGSNVILPKRCDVIGVGIITQRDLTDVGKHILPMNDDLSDVKSKTKMKTHKKCEFAESYLQEYCRNWLPSEFDLFSGQLSDTVLQSSDNSNISYTQRDGTKSCPNKYSEFPVPTVIISSCGTSSFSHCIGLEDAKHDDSLKCKLLNKFKKKSTESHYNSEKRQLPKDSLNVFKKRMLYASTDQKSKWVNSDVDELELSDSFPISKKPCRRLPDTHKNQKEHCKRVSFLGWKEVTRSNDQQSDRSVESFSTYKGSRCNQKVLQYPNHVEELPKTMCKTPQSCNESNIKKKLECKKKNGSPCDEEFQKALNPDSIALNSPNINGKPKKGSPCNNISKIRHACDERDRISKTATQEFVISSKVLRSPKPSLKNVGKKNPNENKQKRLKECLPDCANAKKLLEPPSVPPTEYGTSNIPDRNKNKISGLFFKKLPSKKNTSSNDSSKYSNDEGVICLNSGEKVTIKMKNDSPSTDEISEDLNIKVQNDKGQTLYERTDYRQSGYENKCDLLKNMYNDALIQRASTATVVQDIKSKESKNEIQDVKSDSSIDNMIEINFTLKLKQGNKAIKIMDQAKESRKDIYLAQDKTGHVIETRNKKDVNINIVIKNCKTDPDGANETETYVNSKPSNDDFTKRISEKFQTVSTGYSDIIDHHDFSVHRATVDLTASTEIFDLETDDFNNVRAENCSTSKHKQSQDLLGVFSPRTSNDTFPHTKRLHGSKKKEKLKLFQTPDSINKSDVKEKIRNKLSDISGTENMTVTNNELVKELTYASLDPNCYRDKDSMNYLQLNTKTDFKRSEDRKLSTNKESREYGENDNATSFKRSNPQNCSKLAPNVNLTKHYIPKNDCCYEDTIQKNEEVTCNVGSVDYIHAECANNSKKPSISNKISSSNVSVGTKPISVMPNVAAVDENDRSNAKNKYLTTMLPSLGNFDCREVNEMNNETIFGLSDDDILVENSNLMASFSKCCRKSRMERKGVTADFLQINEVKKAVLEIYAQRIVSDNGERLVAKLPKFDLNDDVDPKDGKVVGRRRVNTSNLVTMSFNQ